MDLDLDRFGNGGTVKDFRGRYYYEKFKILLVSNDHSITANNQNQVTTPELREVMKCYLEGLIWCLAYYVKGCISWQWFYKYHYGPMLQDMTNLKNLADSIKFELGQPFLPFQQLLGTSNII